MNLDDWPRYSNPNYVYHYTSHASADSIVKEKVINVSQARIQHFGTGVFLTELDPTATTHEIIVNNYNGSYKHVHKTECAFALPRNALKMTKLSDPLHPSRNVFRTDNPIYLDQLRYYLVSRSSRSNPVENFYPVSLFCDEE